MKRRRASTKGTLNMYGKTLSCSCTTVIRDLKHQDGRWRRGRHIRVEAEARPASRFTRPSMLSNTATAT